MLFWPGAEGLVKEIAPGLHLFWRERLSNRDVRAMAVALVAPLTPEIALAVSSALVFRVRPAPMVALVTVPNIRWAMMGRLLIGGSLIILKALRVVVVDALAWAYPLLVDPNKVQINDIEFNIIEMIIYQLCQISVKFSLAPPLIQGHVKVGSARGVAPRNPISLAVVVRRSRTTTARESFRGGKASPNPTKGTLTWPCPSSPIA